MAADMSPALVEAIERLAAYLCPRLWNEISGGDLDFSKASNCVLLLACGVL